MFVASIIALLCFTTSISASGVGYHVEEGATWQPVATSGRSTLYTASWTGSAQYENPPQLIELVGDRYTIGL